MEKVKIPRCWLHYVNWTLLAVLLVFCLFDQILYGFRSPEAGLPITRKPLLGFQSFIWLSEDASGHMYALGGGSKVVRMGIDGDGNFLQKYPADSGS